MKSCESLGYQSTLHSNISLLPGFYHALHRMHYIMHFHAFFERSYKLQILSLKLTSRTQTPTLFCNELI